jgi:hypothetical protein
MEKEVVNRTKLMNLVGNFVLLYRDGKISLLENMEEFFSVAREFEGEDFDTYFVGLIEKAFTQVQVDMCVYIQDSIHRIITDEINERYRP